MCVVIDTWGKRQDFLAVYIYMAGQRYSAWIGAAMGHTSYLE